MRIINTINNNWSFCIGEKTENTLLETVNIPHSVMLSPEISSGSLNYQGKYYYSKNICLSKEYINKKIFLRFEAIMGTSKLYIDGKFIKEHTCGYTPFITDITEYITPEKTSLIEITADNSDDPEVPVGKPQQDLDFSYDGGMYRKVQIISTEKLYITDEILADKVAGGGIFFYPGEVSTEKAEVFTKVNVKNETSEKQIFTITTSLTDKNGKTVASEKSPDIILDNNCDTEQVLSMTVLNPDLWYPDCPSMHTLTVCVMQNGTVIDKREIEVGIRRFKFTPEDGTIINGKSYRLSGGNYHQTFPYIGNAMPESLQKRDVIKLARIDTKSIRGHYPMSDVFTQECDRHGITLIVSNPGWQFFNNTEKFKQNAYQNMKDIIRWKRNHPSVILWEHILNETVLPQDFVDTLYDIVHEEYPYNECYCAADYGHADLHYKGYDAGMLSPETTVYGDDSDFTSDLHWIREYGDIPDNFTDQNTSWRSPRWFGDNAMVKSVKRMIGLDNQNIYENYVDVYNNKQLCGYGVWPSIEHNRGYHIAPCWGGHLDLFRLPKFSNYFMESQKDPETDTVLFIANWLTDISPDDIMVISNADSVRLYFNDKFIAEQCPDKINVKHPPFTFKGVINNNRGRNRFTVRAEAVIDGKVVKTEVLKTPGVSKRLELVADLEGIQPVADGSDIFTVHCKVVDDEGNVVALNADRFPIKFTVSGEGSIVGDSSIGANPVYPKAGIASVLIKTTENAGDIVINADFLWINHNIPTSVKPDTLTVTTK